MKRLEWQLSNLELSKKLKSLGVPQESLFYWNFNNAVPEQGWYLDDENLAYDKKDTVSAFTVAELGEKLPKDFYVPKGTEMKVVLFDMLDRTDEANNRAKILIYLIENNEV